MFTLDDIKSMAELAVRFVVILFMFAGFLFGSYLITRAIKKSLKKTGYLVGLVFIMISIGLFIAVFGYKF